MDPGTGSAKAELSTLPESGTFYFALTRYAFSLTGGAQHDIIKHTMNRFKGAIKCEPAFS
jgi:hypothetical protein